jgi:dTDP-4-dehydrorhamnose reductase
MILITGGSGVLGKELQKVFPDALAPTRKELDITNKNLVLQYIKNHKIDTVIHAAALTSVEKCDKEKALAYETNYTGTKNLTEAIKNTNILFVLISTACVFDGLKGNYEEGDIPCPENYYGITKLLAEEEVKRLHSFIIIRTNFVGRTKWKYPKAFTDRFGTYLFADQVAVGIKDILTLQKYQNLLGVFHITGDKKLSMFELAKMTTPEVLPMTLNDYKGARLTIDMTLDTKRCLPYNIKAQ